MIPFYLITNTGTLVGDPYAQHFPRHLFLAQVYRDGSDLYRKTVRMVCRRHNTRCILDCGAYEDVELDLPEYNDIVEAIKPDVVVLPDVIGDAERTFDRAQDFLNLSRFQPKQYMYIPQGSDVVDVLKAYDKAFQRFSPKRFIIGFGKSYYAWCSTLAEREHEHKRVQMVEDVLNIPNAADFRFHIFGARRHPTQRYSQWTDHIVGLDAYDPCVCAIQGSTYPEFLWKGKPPHLSESEPVAADALRENVTVFCTYYGLTAGPLPDDSPTTHHV